MLSAHRLHLPPSPAARQGRREASHVSGPRHEKHRLHLTRRRTRAPIICLPPPPAAARPSRLAPRIRAFAVRRGTRRALAHRRHCQYKTGPVSPHVSPSPCQGPRSPPGLLRAGMPLRRSIDCLRPSQPPPPASRPASPPGTTLPARPARHPLARRRGAARRGCLSWGGRRRRPAPAACPAPSAPAASRPALGPSQPAPPPFIPGPAGRPAGAQPGAANQPVCRIPRPATAHGPPRAAPVRVGAVPHAPPVRAPPRRRARVVCVRLRVCLRLRVSALVRLRACLCVRRAGKPWWRVDSRSSLAACGESPSPSMLGT